MTLPDWQDGNLQAVSPILDQWAATYGLPRDIVYGLVSQESRFNPDALGDAGRAHGLTQIWMTTAQGMGYAGDAQGLQDPNTSAQWGLLYLSNLLNRFGDMSIALSAYNGGYTNNTINDPAYVNGVLARADYFTQQWAGGVAPVSDPALDTTDTTGGGSAVISAMLVAGAGYLLWRGMR